jgi:hypothetical protein
MALAYVLGPGLLPAHGQATRTWVSGVGDDANPCSRTAPCKTFPGALGKTAAGGVISVLDPGGFGAVTITKSITIENEGMNGGILAAGTNGVNINGDDIVVVLRGLTIHGAGTGLVGINFLNGAALHVESCTINGFTTAGIDMSGGSELYVKDTLVRNVDPGGTGLGIHAHPAVTGRLSLDGVRVENSGRGIRVQRAFATIRDTRSSGHAGHGIIAAGGGRLNIESSLAAHNGGVGVLAAGTNAVVRLSNTTVTANATGLDVQDGGNILSFGNNRLFGNTINGVDPGPIALE